MMKFKTKRELDWYIKGLRDAKKTMADFVKIDIERYVSAYDHMDFDKKGNTLDTSAEPTSRGRMYGYRKAKANISLIKEVVVDE